MQRYFAFCEDIHTLRLTSELVDIRVGYAKRIKELCSLAISQRSLHKYDARCCIMQRYFAYGECCEADSAIAEPFDTLLHIS